jgi:hypothetical protein
MVSILLFFLALAASAKVPSLMRNTLGITEHMTYILHTLWTGGLKGKFLICD